MKRFHQWLIGLLLVTVALLAQGQDEAISSPAPLPGDQATEPLPPTVDAIIKALDEMYRMDSSHAIVTLTVIKPRQTRNLRMEIWTKGTERSLIVIQDPPRERGTATLKVDDNLWNYLPRIRRSIRIPPSMMMSSWMGSDFTNDDLVRESSLREDYTYEQVGPHAESGGQIIQLKPKEGVVGLWGRIEFIVTLDPILPIEARYYDRRNRPARTLHWDDVRIFDGKTIPARMTLTPNDEKKAGHKTVLQYEELGFNVDVPDRTFSLTELEQKR